MIDVICVKITKKNREQYSHQYYNDILYVYDLKLMRTDIATINIIICLKYTIIYSAVGLHLFVCLWLGIMSVASHTSSSLFYNYLSSQEISQFMEAGILFIMLTT